MERLRVAGLGASLDLHVTGSRVDEFVPMLRDAWRRCLDRPADVTAEPVTVRLDDTPAEGRLVRGAGVLTSDDADRLMISATQSVTGSLIGARAGSLLMLHAGAVSHPVTGASLVYVAGGGTGKTTLTRFLGRHYGYLTDETVGIDSEDRILPYPKPLSIRVEPGHVHKHEFSPDSLGLRPAPPRPWVAKVILLERSDRHDGPEVTALGTIDAIAGLVPQSSSLSRLDRGLHRCADLLAATGGALHVRYAEAESLLGLAADLIGNPT